MQVPQTAQLQVKTDLNDLAPVLSWFDQLYQPQIPRSFWLQCQLALAEGFTNAVRHAHKNRSPAVPISLEVTLLPEGVELRIWDQGPPFDLAQRLRDLPSVVDQNEIGGRGLRLMVDMTNNLSYTRTADNRNCLLLVKYYEGETGFSQSEITRFS